MAKENSTARNARSRPSTASSTAPGSAGLKEPPPIWHKGSFFLPQLSMEMARLFFFFFLMSNVMPIRCSQSDTISFILGWKCDIAKLWFIHATRRIRVFLSRPSQGGAHRAPRSASKMAFVGQGSSAQQHGGDGALLLGAACQNRSSETFRRFHFSFSIFLLTSFP